MRLKVNPLLIKKHLLIYWGCGKIYSLSRVHTDLFINCLYIIS